jgi:hypothetical protein
LLVDSSPFQQPPPSVNPRNNQIIAIKDKGKEETNAGFAGFARCSSALPPLLLMVQSRGKTRES